MRTSSTCYIGDISPEPLQRQISLFMDYETMSVSTLRFGKPGLLVTGEQEHIMIAIFSGKSEDGSSLAMGLRYLQGVTVGRSGMRQRVGYDGQGSLWRGVSLSSSLHQRAAR